MKKTYIIPTLEVMDLEAEQALLAVSVEGFNAELDATGGDGENALAGDMVLFGDDF
ncbi:MAG: hypothetical protein IJ637_08770 [Prevotella sp.]|nr:hypothetical protein [Prevotella sp.]